MDRMTTLDQHEIMVVAAHHALAIRKLVGAPDQPVMAPNASKEIILAALQAAEIDLLMTFSLITQEECLTRPVCGVWTLQELAGHLADWDRYFFNWLSVLRGNALQTLYWDEDGDAFNHWLVQQRQGEAWEKSWHDMRANRIALVDGFAHVPPDEFMRVQPPNEHVSYPTIYHCAWSALEHYLDHAAGVRRALNLPLPEALLEFRGPYT